MTDSIYTHVVSGLQKPVKRIRLKGKEMEALRRECYNRDRGICQQCNKPVSWKEFHMAHIKSRGAGGSDILENVVTKCRNCHLIKEHTQGIK